MESYIEVLRSLPDHVPSLIAEEIMEKRHYQDGENFDKMCLRIASAIGRNLYEEDIETFYLMMKKGLFFPSSPYMANAGITNSNMSCFVVPVEDSLDGIFDAVRNSAKIQSGYGGVGMSLGNIRYKDCLVSSMKRGGASGPIAFANIFNETNSAIYQGGARSGAGMFTLPVDHPDIEEFITCKDEDGVLSNFNISVSITDEFMEAVKDNTSFSLKFNGKEVKVVHARYIWDLICEHAHQTGEPGLLFIDEINRHNPNLNSLGPIKATNPCAEAALLDNTACNLGSIVISRHLDANNLLDTRLLRLTINNAIQFLDAAYDVNSYPLEIIKQQSLLGRKLGLGVMGWADFLSSQGVRYGSEESYKLARSVMEYINLQAHSMSKFLAEKSGRNVWIDDIDDERKNSACTSIAPNGTVGTIAGVNGGIEPYFALVYQRKVSDKDGTKTDYDVIVPAFEQVFGKRHDYPLIIEKVKANGGMLPERDATFNYTDEQRDILITASQVSPLDHVRMLAAFQENVDMAVSKTINLPNNATVADVKEAYELAYKLKVKGLTVYRDGSREDQVLSTNNKQVEARIIATGVDSWAYKSKEERPMVLDGKTYFIRTTNGKYYITINGENGIPLEIFASPHSKDVEGNVDAEALCRMISLALRSRVPLEAICSQLEKVRLQSLLSLPHNVKKCLEMFSQASQETKQKTIIYDICPECKEPKLIKECGCCKCLSCGFSSCG